MATTRKSTGSKTPTKRTPRTTKAKPKADAAKAPRNPATAKRPRAPATAKVSTRAVVEKSASPGITGRILSWSDSLLGLAGPLSSVSMALTKASLRAPAKGVALTKAATALMQARKSLGMTAQDLARAIDLKSPELIEQAESGKVGLPFEVILRLAAVLGRNDPMAFALKLVRSYNPGLWEKLEAIGVGKLVEHVGREREFVNIYRSSDAARSLSDEEFAQVLTFVESAFEMALAFKLGARR